jgi:hypothetical protein
MDKSSTIIALGLVVLTALPFILYNVYKKMRRKKFMKNFIQLSEKSKLTFSQKELWNNCYAIGLDSGSKKLLYFNNLEGNEEGILIDLSEVEKCRVATIDKHIKNQNNNNETNRLELVITYKNPKIPEKVLEFYKNAEFMPSVDEFAHAESWVNTITANLKTS